MRFAIENKIIEVTVSIAPSKNITTEPSNEPKKITCWFRYASRNIPPRIIPATINTRPGIP